MSSSEGYKALVETAVLQINFTKLVTVISINLTAVANDFFSSNLIGEHEHGSAVDMTGKCNFDKASSLAMSVCNKIGSDPKLFKQLTVVLDNCNQDFSRALVTDVARRKLLLQVLLEHHMLLVGVFDTCLPEIARILQHNMIVDRDFLIGINASNISSIEKSFNLVNLVRQRIKENPEMFEIFVSLLDDHFYPSIGKVGTFLKMEKELHSRRSVTTATVVPHPDESLIDDDFKDKALVLCEEAIKKLEDNRVTKEKKFPKTQVRLERVERQQEMLHTQSTGNELARLNAELQDISRKELQKTQEDKEKLKKEISEMESQKAQLMLQKENLINDLTKVNKERDEYRMEVEQLQEQLEKVEKDLGETQLKLMEAEQKLDLAELKHKHELEELQKRLEYKMINELKKLELEYKRIKRAAKLEHKKDLEFKNY